MKLDKKFLRLYAVTDRHWVGKESLLEQIEEALKNGVTLVQLREKNLSEEDFLKEAIQVRNLCHQYQVPFIVNDNVNVAIRSSADGVHVGQEDMKAQDVRKLIGENMILGVSVHSVEEAILAKKNGADYLGIGSVFNTTTKKDATSVPLKVVKEITDSVEIPSVAIGGINQDNILKLKGSNINGVAIVSAIFGAKNISRATNQLVKKVNELLEA